MPFGMGHGRRSAGVPLDAHDQAVMAEFRKDIFIYGTMGFGAGICAGILATPYCKKLIGKHANVAVPLGVGSLFSMFGSAIATNQHSHSMAYSKFKRQESMRLNANNYQQHYLNRKREGGESKETFPSTGGLGR